MTKKPLGPEIRVDVDLEDAVREFAYVNRLSITRAANVLMRRALEREQSGRYLAGRNA